MRRDPSLGPLHRLLSSKLTGYLHRRRDRPLAPFVQKALTSYLECGDLWHGFARFKCEDCPQSMLVALSCKQRAFCPRCGGRRMAAQAKHLVEQVLPDVPYRQWVLTLPYALRWRMAFDHDLTLAVWAVARRAVHSFYRKRVGTPGGAAHPGGVMAIQRFGGALNLNVHFHALYMDGVFVERADGAVEFIRAPPPTLAELEALTATIRRRLARLLRRRGLGPDVDGDADQLDLPQMARACSDGVTNKGAWQIRTEPPREASRYPRLKANVDGVDLDAHVTVRAGARNELERLVRYILRPPIQEKRLTLGDDHVTLELKRAWRNGTTHVRMSSSSFIDRLAALVPPPRSNMLLYGGALAANARLRRQVVSYGRLGNGTMPKTPGQLLQARRARKRAAQPDRTAADHSRNVAWAELMRHSFELDVLACRSCGGRMKHIATVMSNAGVRRILLHRGHPDPKAGDTTPRGSPETHYELDTEVAAELDLAEEW